MLNSPVDFRAELTFLTAKEGGRENPAKSGYMPQIKFHLSEKQTGGQQIFINKETVYPGDTVEADIKLLSPHFFEYQLSEKMDFEFREGSKIVGTGIIIRLLNPKLVKASS